jgi:glycogen operon protein
MLDRPPHAPHVRPAGLIEPGLPFPLGASWDGLGVNFALFSAHATKVELCLFTPDGRREVSRIELPEYTDEIWHGYLPDARPGTVYGYRVHGPYEPAAGHRFNPHKLVLDPYAKALVGKLTWSDTLFGYRLGSPREDLSFDRRDSAGFMPKCRVIDPAFTWGRERPPAVPWEHTIFYEAHVKGMTRLHPAVPEALRGTYAGLGQRAVVDYIRSLGVTSVELMPVHAFVDDRYLLDKGLRNYWGYNTIAFFAPDPRYSASGSTEEFKEMVARLHDAGLEVILDVVYNHTAEGNERGPTLSFRGIDNATYYKLLPDNPRFYINDTGTGNTFDLTHGRVVQLVTDSLRYWVNELHVDGFRFDLATILGREPYGFNESGGFLDSVRQDPVLARVKLIAEPWDIGPGGYRVGGFPPGWAEWNDRFRDTVRAYWRGDEGKLPEVATRIAGSADVFHRRGRKAWASVNFVTAHDGFTLADLVAYNDKHNEANGEENRDGHSNNHSWNHGAEGPTDDPSVIALRERQKRNLLATLLFSQGTPMLQAGDELGRSQHGNNNAYCQDNELSWIDWAAVDECGRELTLFTRRLIALRRRYPVLQRSRFTTGQPEPEQGARDITWLTPAGVEPAAEQWQDAAARCLGVVLDGRVQNGQLRAPQAEVLLLVLNAYHDVVRFTLPATPGAARWALLVDTNQPALAGQPSFAVGHEYEVTGRSLLLLLMEPGAAEPPAAAEPADQAEAMTAAAGIVTAATLPEAAPAAEDAPAAPALSPAP